LVFCVKGGTSASEKLKGRQAFFTPKEAEHLLAQVLEPPLQDCIHISQNLPASAHMNLSQGYEKTLLLNYL